MCIHSPQSRSKMRQYYTGKIKNLEVAETSKFFLWHRSIGRLRGVGRRFSGRWGFGWPRCRGWRDGRRIGWRWRQGWCGGGGQGGSWQIDRADQTQAKQFAKDPSAFILLVGWDFLIGGDQKPCFIFVHCAEGQAFSQPQGFTKNCVICARP
jgi:hypothetical protein